MPVGQAQMPLFDHLSELRRRLTVVIVVLLITTLGLYFVSSQLILVLIRPIAEYLNGGQIINTLEELRQVLITLNPMGGFALRFEVAFVFSLLATSPVWIGQLLGFFVPALNPNERKWVLPTFFAAVLLFAIGMVFCYLVILDPAFQWMTSQSEEFSKITANAPDYVNIILLFEVGFGLAFELPLVVFYLTVFNIIPYKKLRASWRVVYIVLMLVSAIVTPDANPVTMLLMFAAMAILYEGSLFVSRIVLSHRLAKEKREDLALDNSAE
ncbi:MAG: twin-arginine translocase subunit TatC [Actinomycetia bacterium]|nr:twin-arginine translocase subunit TatC [Actinomycetes bacterium]